MIAGWGHQLPNHVTHGCVQPIPAKAVQCVHCVVIAKGVLCLKGKPSAQGEHGGDRTGEYQSLVLMDSERDGIEHVSNVPVMYRRQQTVLR